MTSRLKPMPSLSSDREAKRFVDSADLTQYDLSGFEQTRFELEARLPDGQEADQKSSSGRKPMDIIRKNLLRWGMALGLLAGSALALAQDWQTYQGAAKVTLQYPVGWSIEEWQSVPPDVEKTLRADLYTLAAMLHIPNMMGMDHTQMVANLSFLQPVLHIKGTDGEEVIAAVGAPPMPGMVDMMGDMIGRYLTQDTIADSADGVNKARLHLEMGKSGLGILLMKAPPQTFDQVNTQVFDHMSQSFAVK
jgi:hypothetical protein